MISKIREQLWAISRSGAREPRRATTSRVHGLMREVQRELGTGDYWRSRRMAWLAVIALALVTPLNADDQRPAKAPAAVTLEQVNALATDLASDSRAARVKAEQNLIALGPEALELLPHPEATRDPQTRESLARIARAIEAADAERALEARTVSVPGMQTRRAWIEQTAAKTGNLIREQDLPQPWLDTVTKPPRLEPRTFWEVIRWLEADHAVRVEIGREALLRPHDENSEAQSRPLAESLRGPFRVQCVECQARPLGSGGHLVRIRLRLLCEPRLRTLFMVSAVDRWHVDAKPTDLAPYTPGASRELPGDPRGIEVAWDFVVPPTSPVPTTIDIDGDLSLTLATRSSTIDFRDLKGPFPITRRRGQASISLLAMHTNPDSTTMRMAVALGDSNGLFESYRAALMAPDLALIINPGSLPVTTATTDLVQEEPDGIVVESRFSGVSLTGTSRLEAYLPTAITTHSVAFSLLDVPVSQTVTE